MDHTAGGTGSTRHLQDKLTEYRRRADILVQTLTPLLMMIRVKFDCNHTYTVCQPFSRVSVT
jgi:hypothetical protein